ncbi:MAG TPA: CDP-alcohol phosphatidyltransferase family protein [Acidobacteriaceae bacterium]|nr:CDP-alcohol phosphatidyltransferase family protein [Acidobacteriaceae bacterium]
MSTNSLTPTAPMYTPAVRINRSLTANAERRLLEHLAARTPRGITSDHLTLLGWAAQIFAGLFYALSRTHPLALLAVNACIILNWLGDSLDGTLARVRDQQRPRFGFYVDHITDLFGVTALLTGLAFSGLAHPLVAAAMLVGFLLLSAESFLATHTLARFELSQFLFGPTELRLLLIIGNLFLLRSPYAHIPFTHSPAHSILLFDLGGIIGSVCMIALAITLTLRHTAQLFHAEPLPRAEP